MTVLMQANDVRRYYMVGGGLFGRKGTVDLRWVMANYSAAAAELIAFDNQLRADQKPLLPAR